MNCKLHLILLVFFLFLKTAVCLSQETMTVKGSVISAEDNEPVIGCSVILKDDPSVGVSTDLDGNFQLNVPKNARTLVFSYLGMKTREVAVKPNLRVVLEPDTRVLGEIVVTGMQKIDKRLFTGATAKIDVGEAKIDGLADISRSLEGRAAGLSVQNVSGTFGSAPKIRIRGATSIYGSSRPLWVVDGIILEDNIELSAEDLSSGNAETLISSAIAGLNADDIESIDVLKDGASTSIYGARAMAGVVVVTTKRGKAGMTSLSYVGEFTTRLKPSYRDFNISNSQEQMGIYKEMEEKGWLGASRFSSASNSGIYGKMYELLSKRGADGEYLLINDEASKNAFLREAEFANTDWFDRLFNLNVMQNHSVSISSGTERARSYISLSALTDPGWTKSASVNRYTVNAKGEYELFPSLKLTMQGNGSHRDQKAPGTIGQETDPVSGKVKRGFDINPYSYAINTSRVLDPDAYYRRNYAPFNIFNELENNYIDLGQSDIKVQADLDWKILKGWTAKVLASVRYSTTEYEHHVKDHSNQAMAYRAGVEEGEGGEDASIRDSNPYLYTDPEVEGALPETILPKGGIYTRTTFDLKSVDFRFSSSYVTALKENNLIDLFGGMEINSTDRSNSWFRGWGYQYEMGGNPFYDYKVFKQGKEENTNYFSKQTTTYKNVAFFGTGTYSFDGKYVLAGTLRYEGSNKLGRSRKSRWLPTWNVSGAWNAHEESWFQNEVMNRGVLKASYSLTADRGPAWVANSTALFSAFTPWRPSDSVIESGIGLSDLENEALTYEKKHELNFGIDLGFLNDRIGLVADYYIRKNFDLIGRIYTTGESGGGIRKWGNSASMESSGIEIGLSSRNIVTSHFKWTTNINFAKTKNEITRLRSNPQVLDLVTGSLYARREGYPVGALFSIPFVELTNEGMPVFTNQNGETTTSNIYFQESEKLDFLKYEGSIDPTVTGSFGNNFSYKGLQLNVYITYAFGNVVRLRPLFSSVYSDLDAMPREFKNRWTTPGDEHKTRIPAIANYRQYGKIEDLSAAYNAYNFSTARVAKGDFVRLKDVSLGYNVPKKIVSSLKLNSLQFKLMATNLLLLYADKKLNGQDPEFFNSGGVAVPLPKQFTLTVRVGL